MGITTTLPRMKSSNLGPAQTDASNRKLWLYNIFPAAAFLCILVFSGIAFVKLDSIEKVRWLPTYSFNNTQSVSGIRKLNLEPTESLPRTYTALSHPNPCEDQCGSLGTESLPKGIVTRTSNLEMDSFLGSLKEKENATSLKSLLTITVGTKQKEVVNKIIKKFAPSDFTVMLFHYDGAVDDWRDLQWSDNVIHISAVNQSKWWFAKRFLHPDIVAEYNYIFLWDEDLEVENFDPKRYLKIVEREGLHISQPALDARKSQVHHAITARWRKGDVHRRIYNLGGGRKCNDNNTGPPCTGWVEMMAPVFSRASWRCTWHMIQNDFVYAWGLDMKLGYCAQGDRRKNVGIVDSEYIVHMGLPTLGGIYDEQKASPGPPTANHRLEVRLRSSHELNMFNKRWEEAVSRDNCWTDPYAEIVANTSR